jgi:Holliday junction resolvasome RuvABC endonuclease subunit
MMNILGVDLSLTSTGISANGKTGTITTPAKGPERLSIISLAVLDAVIDNSIQLVAIEGYSFASRNSQAHSIGELGGVVRTRLWERNIPYIDIPPTCRAKFATGKGNAAKTEVMSSISAKTGLVFSGKGADDMCDAWILEEMCRTRIGISDYTWSAAQLSALDKIDWGALTSIQTTKENRAL